MSTQKFFNFSTAVVYITFRVQTFKISHLWQLLNEMNVCGMGEYALTVLIEPLSEWHWKFWLTISDPSRAVDSLCLWNDCVQVLGKWSEEGSRWPWVSRFHYCWLVFERFAVVLGSRDVSHCIAPPAFSSNSRQLGDVIACCCAAPTRPFWHCLAGRDPLLVYLSSIHSGWSVSLCLVHGHHNLFVCSQKAAAAAGTP